MPVFLSTVRTYIRILRLPVLLAGLFVIQNQAFTYFLHIVPELYFRTIVVTFGLGMLLYGLVVFLSSRIRYWYLLAISTLVSIIFISQYLYYSYFQGFYQITAFKYAHQAGEIAGAIGILFSPVLLIFIVNVCAVLIAMACVWRKRREAPRGLSWKRKIALACAMMSIVVSGY